MSATPSRALGASPDAGTTNAPPKSPIGVSNIVIRLDRHDQIGLAGGDFRIHLIERLRERGFNAVGAESLVFDKDESHRAAFRIGGIVRELECRAVGAENRCRIGVEWQLLDVSRDAVIYSTVARAMVAEPRTSEASPVAVKLLLGAFDRLLARPRFRGVLAAHDSGQEAESDPSFSPMTFAKCSPIGKKMPDAAEQVLRSTLVVRTGDGFGSGFFISPDGLVVTAAHVLHGPKVTLRMRDGSEVDAVPVRVARRADVALLRPARAVSTPGCLAVSATDSPAMGSELYVAGAPAALDLAFSLTRGIVSAVREKDGRRVLQTDAPVSPGNSGGPMVDQDGAVLAVTTAKIAGHAVEGVSFGIPIRYALSSLGLSPGATTDASLATAPPAPLEPPRAAAPVQDEADPVPTLDPEGDREQARRAAEAAERERREAPRRIQREREEIRDRATPTYLKVFNVGGWLFAGAGTLTALVSYSQYSPHASTRPEYTSATIYNTIGWSAAAIGVTGIVAYYALRPPLPPAPTTGRLSIGLGGVRWEGSF